MLMMLLTRPRDSHRVCAARGFGIHSGRPWESAGLANSCEVGGERMNGQPGLETLKALAGIEDISKSVAASLDISRHLAATKKITEHLAGIADMSKKLMMMSDFRPFMPPDLSTIPLATNPLVTHADANLASAFYERLAEAINRFNESLDSAHEVG